MRNGRTREHYLRQKNSSAARFRVNAGDLAKIRGGQYTIYDFIDNAFSFSPVKKELTIQILSALRERPRSFAELQKEFGLKKSTLYLLVLALERSGVVEASGRGRPISLSPRFSQILRENASWWENWLKTNSPSPSPAP